MNQETLNQKMLDEGRERFEDGIKRAKESGHESGTVYGSQLLKHAIYPFTAAIDDWKEQVQSIGRGSRGKAFTYLKDVDSELIAAIAARIIIDQITKTNQFTALAQAVATAVEEEVRIAKFKEDAPEDFKRMKKYSKSKNPRIRRQALTVAHANSKAEWKAWPTSDKQHVGSLLLGEFKRATTMIEIDTMKDSAFGKPKSSVVVFPTQKCIDFIENCSEFHALRQPVYMPMVVKPHTQTNQWDGGYDDAVSGNLSVFRGVRPEWLDTMTEENMPQVYKALNTIQDTKWMINEDVLMTFDIVWRQQEGKRAGLPPKEPLKIPEKPEDWKENKNAHKEWKRKASSTWKEETRLCSKRMAIGKIYQVAFGLVDQDVYFPHYFCFRGRIYPMPTNLSPQGVDAAKALLTFRHGAVMDEDAVRHFKVHGANCAGMDKLELGARVDWIDQNHEGILSVADDPFDTRFLDFQQMDEPFQFLAFCFAYAEWYADPQGYECSLPCAADATCSGLQIYSLLMRDPINARATNVLSTGRREDLYLQVADAITEKLKGYANTDIKPYGDLSAETTSKYANELLAFCGGSLPRKSTKSSCMTLTYGLTYYSHKDNVMEWLRDMIDEHDYFTREEPPFDRPYLRAHFLADLIWDDLKARVGAAFKGMEWLQKAAKLMAEANIPMTWVSPAGFRVEQRKVEEKWRQVKTAAGEVMFKAVIRTRTDKISASGQASSIAPNLVHSLDSSILMLTVNRCKDEGVKSFACIHDSLGTIPAHMSILHRNVRKVTAEIFESDYLRYLWSKWNMELKSVDFEDRIPEPPEQGDLDVQCVLKSPYYYS